MSRSSKKLPERFPSNAERDLATRTAEGHVQESDLANRTSTVQPSPQGNGSFVGTDLIYQNRANETDRPFPAGEGPERDAEEAFVEQFTQPDEDATFHMDQGLGGTAVPTVSHLAQPDVPDVTVGASADVTHGDAAPESEVEALKQRVDALENAATDPEPAPEDEDEDKEEEKGGSGDGSSSQTPTPTPPTPPTS